MHTAFATCLVAGDDRRHAARPGLGLSRAFCGAGAAQQVLPGEFTADDPSSCPACTAFVLPYLPRQRDGQR